jgi:hypothetical protein
VFYSFSLADSFNDFKNFGMSLKISCGEEMMRSVNVESCQEKISKESSNPCISIVSGKDSMFTEILDPFSALRPKFLETVTTKKHSIEKEAK